MGGLGGWGDIAAGGDHSVVAQPRDGRALARVHQERRLLARPCPRQPGRHARAPRRPPARARLFRHGARARCTAASRRWRAYAAGTCEELGRVGRAVDDGEDEGLQVCRPG